MTAGLSEAIQNEILSRIPLRSFGNSKEVASLILYLASPAARYITGQVIAIDGGMRCEKARISIACAISPLLAKTSFPMRGPPQPLALELGSFVTDLLGDTRVETSDTN